MEKAFDAFTQRRNTGTQDRVTERRRVDTYTDPNRYQMPPRRRLGIHASNKSMFVDPAKSNITAFAEGLAEVQPDIMNYLAKEEIEKNKKEVQYGIKDAMATEAMKAGDTEFVDSEWRQFAFEQKKAYMAGEELATQLSLDVQTKDPMLDFDSWYEDWYAKKMEEFPHLATMDPEVMESYNKPMMKGFTAAKNQAMLDYENEQQRQYVQTSTDYTKRTIEDAIKKGYEVNNELIERIINDEINMSRWGRDKANDIIFNAIRDIAIANDDASLLDYFDEKRGPDGKIPSVRTMRATEIEAIEKKIESNIDAKNRDEAARLKAADDLIVDNQKSAKDELTIMIGDPADMKGMEIPGEASPAEKARQARYDAMKMYTNIKKQLKTAGENGYAMTEAEAHEEALRRVKASRLVQSNLSAAYSDAQMRKSKAWRSSYDFVTQTKEDLGDKYEDYSADLYEAIQAGQDPSTILPEWSMKDGNGDDFIHPEHKKLLEAEGKAAHLRRRKKQLDATRAAAKEVDKDVAANVPQEDNTPTTTTLTPAEEKAFDDMYKAGDEKAGKLDFSEEDRPKFTEDYEPRQDDNQGLQPGGIEYISEDRPTQVEGDGFGDSIFGKIYDGITGAFGAIYNYDGPSPIAVDPLGQDSIEYDYTTRNTDGTYSVKPKVWEPGDQKYVVQTPDVNTNPNLAEIKPEDVSEKNTFQEQLKVSESSGNYNAVSVQNNKEYVGAYQFGKARLDDYRKAKGTKFSKQDFINNPKLQDQVYAWHVQDIRETIVESGVYNKIGTTVKGIPVTMNGLIAVAHLGGKQGMIDFINSNGKKDKQDKNGTKMSTYLRRFSS